MKKLNKVLTVMISLALFHHLAFAQWTPVTSGTANFITSVQMISTTTNYAAGFGGIVLKSTNTGQTWTTLSSPSASNINKMFFPATGNATTGWAASVSGLYKTTNGGANWTQQIASVVFNDVFFTDLNTGFAVTSASVRKTTNGGTNYSTITFSSNSTIHGSVISQGNSSTYFLLGLENVNDTSYIFKSTDVGATWSQTFRTPLDFFDIAFVNASTGIMCGQDGNLKRTTNGGTNWTNINTGTTEDLQALKYISTTKVFAAGSGGTILKSTDGGLTWVHQTSGTTSALRGLDLFTSDDFGIAGGANGTMVRTINGGSGTVGIIQENGNIPDRFSLSQNYPNPFNPSTKLNFRIANTGSVQLKVYDILGNEIETVVNENMQPGSYSVIFNAGNLPSGTYFYRLNAGDFSETKKMVLIK